MALKSFLKKFFGIKKPRERILTNINPDEEESKKIKEYAKKVKSLEAQMSDIKAKKREQSEEKKEFVDEVKLIKEIKQHSDSIKEKKFEGAFELTYIDILLRRHKKLRIEITDRDDTIIFDEYKSIVLIPNVGFGIMGRSGRIWSYGKTADSVIYKPEAMRHHIKRKRIPIPYDKELKPIPDLDKMMTKEIRYNPETDDFNITEELEKPFRQILMDRERKISSLMEDKEYLEKLTLAQNNNLKKIDRNFNVLKAQYQFGESEISVATSSMIEMSKKMGEITRRNTMLAQQKLSSDDLVDMYEGAMDKLMGQLEDEKSRNSVRKAKDELHRDLNFAERFGKKTVIQTGEGTSSEAIKPGIPLK